MFAERYDTSIRTWPANRTRATTVPSDWTWATAGSTDWTWATPGSTDWAGTASWSAKRPEATEGSKAKAQAGEKSAQAKGSEKATTEMMIGVVDFPKEPILQ